MDTFLRRFSEKVIGVLHGFDRLRFRGSRRGLCYPTGLLGFLWHMHILLKDFGDFAQDTTNTLCQAIETRARELEVPTTYLEKKGNAASALSWPLARLTPRPYSKPERPLRICAKEICAARTKIDG